MLDQRVTLFEEKFDRVEASLARFERAVSEIALTNAKQADLHNVEIRVTELSLTGARQADLVKLQLDVAEMKGRISGLDARIAALPTTWTLHGVVFTTWALGSGILIFAMNFLKR